MSVLDIIGNTPLIELVKLNPFKDKVRILMKFEGSNPGGSVKDRPALHMIRTAENRGLLNSSKTIIEPTSGNTGIAIAMIGAVRGYKVRLFMPACVSMERRHILEAFGAELVLTPAEEKTDGAIRKARQLQADDPEHYFMPNQFENESNILAHYEGTGPEIYRQTGGEIDVFIAGMGTTGTLMGTGRYLKEQNPRIKIVGVEPVLNHSIQGLKNMQEAIVPKIYNPAALDEIVVIEDQQAFTMTTRLVTEEGLFIGMSSGAAVAGALHLAEQMQSGTIVTLLPDRGDRYLSTNLFKSMCGKCRP